MEKENLESARNDMITEELKTEMASHGRQETEIDDTSVERTTKFLIEDKSIPEHMRKLLWSTADKEMVVSNFSDGDMLHVRNMQKVLELAHICNMPPNTYTFSDDLDMINMDLKVFVKVNRSHHGFERQQLTTQTKIMSIKADMAGRKKRRFGASIGRLFGRSGEQQV